MQSVMLLSWRERYWDWEWEWEYVREIAIYSGKDVDEKSGTVVFFYQIYRWCSEVSGPISFVCLLGQDKVG